MKCRSEVLATTTPVSMHECSYLLTTSITASRLPTVPLAPPLPLNSGGCFPDRSRPAAGTARSPARRRQDEGQQVLCETAAHHQRHSAARGAVAVSWHPEDIC